MVTSRCSNCELRIFLDPEDLNRTKEKGHRVSSTVEEDTPKLTGTQYFSTFDVNKRLLGSKTLKVHF